jgi:ABC-type transporter Mla subunit MlaD
MTDVTGSGNMIQIKDTLSSADTAYNASKGLVDQAKTQLDAFMAKTGELSDAEMIQFNLAASNYSTRLSLVSGLVKNLSDTEKQIANKM